MFFGEVFPQPCLFAGIIAQRTVAEMLVQLPRYVVHFLDVFAEAIKVPELLEAKLALEPLHMDAENVSNEATVLMLNRWRTNGAHVVLGRRDMKDGCE